MSRLNKPSSFSLPSKGKCYSPKDDLGGPPLNLLQFIDIFLALERSTVETVFLTCPTKCQVEWDNHFPRATGCAPIITGQDTGVLLCCHSLLLAHIQFAVYQDSPIVFSRTASPASAFPAFMCSIWLTLYHIPSRKTDSS